MRKNTYFILMLMFVVLSLAVAPAFAGYDHGDVMMDQADHHTLSGFNAFYQQKGDHGTANTWGQLADENPIYRPGTIYIPYANKTYGFWDCPDVQVGEPGKPTIGLKKEYQHCPSPDPNTGGFYEQEAKLIIQDLFTVVTEGTVKKDPHAKGIAQYLDSLFVFSNPDGEANSGDEAVYISQTLDQDLADMYGETNPITGVAYGLWQRLHSAVDILATRPLNDNYASTTSGFDPLNDPGDPIGRAFDFTMEQYLGEESGASSLGLTKSLVAPGDVIVYLGEWFQMGDKNTCPNCTHNEWGGHGTVTASPYKPSLTQHDP